MERQPSSTHPDGDGPLGSTGTYTTPLQSPNKHNSNQNHFSTMHATSSSAAPVLTPPLRARRFPHPNMGSSIPSFDASGSGNVSALSSPQVGSAGAGGMRRTNSNNSAVTTPYHSITTPMVGGAGSSAFSPQVSSDALLLGGGAGLLGASCAQVGGSVGNSPQRQHSSTTIGGTSPSSPPRLESPGIGPTSSSGLMLSVEAVHQQQRTTSSSMLMMSSDSNNNASKRTPTPTTPSAHPQPTSQMGGIDHAAVDVQGFYSQHQVNGIPVIPQELPRSPFLYVLTTSEGRDKLFKCLQYALKIGIWLCFRSDIIPEGASAFAKTLALRLAGNVQTIRSGRSMFKLGRWIITLFHLQVVNARLMKRHTPQLYDRMLLLQEAIGRAFEVIGQSIVRLAASVGLRGLPKPQVILSAPPSVMSSMDVCSEDDGEQSLRSNGGPPPAFHTTTPPMPPMGLVPRFYINTTAANNLHSAAERRLSSSQDAASAAVTPSGAVSPNRTRSVTFPTLPHQTKSQQVSDDERPFSTPPQEGDGHDAPTPASYAFASRWRRTAESFSSPLMALLSLRCTLSVVRNVVRDGLFLSSREFIHAPSIQRHHNQLQKVANYSWMAVSVLDVALNTWRLMDAGWLKYVSVRRNPRAYCLCDEQQVGRFHHHGGTRPGDSVSFAPLDLDFGSVTPTTAKFVEAAPPAQLRPICNYCGYVISDAAASGESTPNSDNHNNKPLMVPWLVRKGFDLVWICGQHSNLAQTLLLEIRYLSDVLLSAGYSVGDFEPAEGEEPLAQHLHLPASLAGFVSALIALHRVRLST